MSMHRGKLNLYFSDGSPYARICRMAVRERELSSEVAEIATTLRDPNAVVLPHNPTGRVPALVLTDGVTLTETTMILLWLDDLGAAPRLLSKQASAMAQYGRALGLLDGIAVWNRELRRPESERSPSVLALELTRANRIGDALEIDVAAGAYATIDAATLALLAVLGYCEIRHTAWKWRAGRPALCAWFDRVSDRDSFAQTLPPPSGI